MLLHVLQTLVNIWTREIDFWKVGSGKAVFAVYQWGSNDRIRNFLLGYLTHVEQLTHQSHALHLVVIKHMCVGIQ